MNDAVLEELKKQTKLLEYIAKAFVSWQNQDKDYHEQTLSEMRR